MMCLNRKNLTHEAASSNWGSPPVLIWFVKSSKNTSSPQS